MTELNLTAPRELQKITREKRLFCHCKELIALPELKEQVPNLKELYCFNNKLTTLPELPPGLKELFFSDNNLTALPDLPSELEMLFYEDNNLIKEIPFTKKDKKVRSLFWWAAQNIYFKYILHKN